MVRQLLVSAILGPPVALATTLVLSLSALVLGSSRAMTVPAPWALTAMLLYALAASYIVGIVPGLLVGFANGVLARRQLSAWPRSILSAVIGAGVALTTIVVTSRGVLPPLSTLLQFAVAGTAMSLVCAALATRRQP
jgi:hypothetical protein